MLSRLTLLVLLVSLTGLGGCTKCGWIWEDWRQSPRSCLPDAPRS